MTLGFLIRVRNRSDRAIVVGLVCGLVIIVGRTAPASTLVNFNTPGQLTTLFATPDTTNLAAQVAGVGFGGSGGVEPPAVANAQFWTLQTSFGGTDPTWTTAILWNSGSAGLPVYGSIGMMAEPLGFSGSSPQQPSTVKNSSSAADRIPFIGFNFGSGVFDLIAYDPIVGDQLIQGEEVPGVFPEQPWASDTWYRSFVRIGYSGSKGQYAVAAQTYLIDQDGFDVAWMQNVAGALTSTALAGDSAVDTYFGMQLDTGFVGPLDNFNTEAVTINPVPEPSPYTLWAAGLAFAALNRLRRPQGRLGRG